MICVDYVPILYNVQYEFGTFWFNTVEKLILWHIYVKVYILCDLSWGAAGEETVGRLALV